MIRILMVEDSLTERVFLKSILESDPEVQVVGVVGNGRDAVRAAAELSPDLITMDIQLPGMNGIEATREIMETHPTRIVIFSRAVDAASREGAFEALRAGALEVLEKPSGMGVGQLVKLREQLLQTIKLMSVVKVVRRRPRGTRPPVDTVQPPAPEGTISIVTVGASTGGPAALNTFLSGLTPDFPVPVVIVQHISSGFTTNLVEWLNRQSPLQIEIAHAHQTVERGHVYVAPEDVHLVFTRRDVLGFEAGPPVNAVRPSATVLFESAAKHYGSEVLGILLTGIGDDGAAGLRAIRDAGGVTFAQDEQTSVVYGMPKAAAALGAAQCVLSIDEMAPALAKAVAAGEAPCA